MVPGDEVWSVEVEGVVPPNKLVDANGVDVSVLGCVVVELNKNPLPLRVWLTGVDCPKKLVFVCVVEPKLNMMIFI
jgi:hypothetical protein